MLSEVDKLLMMTKDLADCLSNIELKLKQFQHSEARRKHNQEQQLKQSFKQDMVKICESYEAELRQKDEYIKKLENAVIGRRYW